MIYLNAYQLVPIRRLVELLGEVYGHKPIQALIQSAN